MPVECGVVDLHAIHSYVALAGFGIARYYTRQCDEAAGVFRPALEDGKLIERKIVAANDFLARSGGNCFRKELSHFRQHGQHFYFVEESLRRFYVHELANAVGDLVEFVDFEGEIHAAGGAELVDEDLGAGMAFDILEKQSWAAGLPGFARRDSRGRLSPRNLLADAVGDFGDLQDGVDFGTDFS